MTPNRAGMHGNSGHVAPQISSRGRKAPPSPIRKLTPFANAAKQRGVKVYHLNIGQPDIKSPKEYFEGLRSFKDEVVAYEPAKGNERLCSAWSAFMNKTLGLETAPQQFLITSGASEALVYAFCACCDPNDEVLMFDPSYANYIGFAAASGITPKAVPTSIKSQFALPSREEIEKVITKKTRAIVFCNPNNPTGTVYSREEVQMLISLCEDHGIFLIADETYREFAYDGKEPFSVFHLSPGNQHVIVVDSLSKRFSLCGARIGCMLTYNEEVLHACNRLAMARLSVSTVEQLAAAHLLERIDPNFTIPIRDEYQRRRDTLLRELGKIPGVEAHKPHGAFYLIAGLPVPNAEEFATYMLREFNYNGATTFVAPGAGFYLNPNNGLNEVRIAYVLNESDIVSAVKCLAEGLIAFQNR